jgi:U32 family peptidase
MVKYMKQTDKITKPELLAPAGNLATALTALDCGADAVYLGLNKFNAREKSDNFSFADLSKLLAYSRERKKKVYVALNTLIKESELVEVAEYLGQLADLNPDAVIVQDIGVMRMIREFFPSLEIHASTQMGIHNSTGIKLLDALGVSRVILERQVTLKELETIMPKSPLEVEVFVHGALCCSLSGQCIFSSWLGGWSGNRGKCKQACRRRFFSRNGNGFFFSPQDLYMLEHIHELKELGIASLKIEGRLRKPDYVRSVVTAYRMILDCEGKPSKTLLGEARNILSGSPGRKWSTGFSSPEAMNSLIQYDSMGASGLLCGKVLETRQYGFKMNVTRRLRVGDRIRIQPTSGEEGPAMTITKMSIDRTPTKRASRGSDCFIFCDREISNGGMVYKIGESSDDLSSRIAKLPLQLPALDLSITAALNGITVRFGQKGIPEWSYEHEFALAEKHPVTAEKLCEAFKIAPPDFCIPGNVQAKIKDNIFIAAGELKTIRREFWAWIEANVSPQTLTGSGIRGMEAFRRYYQEIKKTTAKHEKEAVAIKIGGCRPAKRDGVLAISIFNFNKLTDEVILPRFCPEDRLDGLEKRIKMAYQAGIRRFRITSLFELEMLKKYRELSITTSFPLPITNSLAIAELKYTGVSRAQAWVELEKTEMELLRDKSVMPLEIYRYGRPELLATRATVAVDGLIRDARNNNFIVEHDKRSMMTYILSKEVMSIPRLTGTVDFYDLTNAYWNEKETSTFNFENVMI